MIEYMWLLVALTYFGVIVYQIRSKTNNPAFSIIGLLLLKIYMEMPSSMLINASSLIVIVAVVANMIYVYKNFVKGQFKKKETPVE